MKEDICTIPINEIFDESDGCPFCRLRKKLESRALDYISGAAMMEPDIRIKTNEKGFCEKHYAGLVSCGKRLPVALMLQSHCNEIRFSLFGGSASAKKKAEKARAFHSGCYVCDSVDFNFRNLLVQFTRMYKQDDDFRKAFTLQPRLCLPHYADLLSVGEKELDKRSFAKLSDDCDLMLARTLKEEYDRISAFCKSFDYNSEIVPDGKAIEKMIEVL